MTDGDLPAAGRLLAARHRAHRSRFPQLPHVFEKPAAAEAEVVECWKAEGASGAVALRGDELVGFLVGAPRQGPLWGPNLWVGAAGHAVAEAEVLRDLYGLAAARWVAEGRTAHYALVPAPDEDLVRAWFRLGFGHQHAHAVRDIDHAGTSTPVPRGLKVRPARRDDVPVLARLDLELPRHQGLSPVFSPGEMPTLEEAVEACEEDVADDSFGFFVAERDGEVVGSAVGCPVEKSGAHSGLARPVNAGLLSFAAVFPSARGGGAGRALAEAVLTWCAERGFDSVVTDWRTTNLLSSRAWPALGFEETFVRLHRMIGH
jgi:GNAT superfamily N-acetyltransferase